MHVRREFINFVGDMYYFDRKKFVCEKIIEIHDNTSSISLRV